MLKPRTILCRSLTNEILPNLAAVLLWACSFSIAENKAGLSLRQASLNEKENSVVHLLR